jgi:signal transduction histidine kinase
VDEDLLSTISHAVRTPMMVIRTNAQLVKQLAGKPERRELLVQSGADILTSADHLGRIVNDMIDLLRLCCCTVGDRQQPLSLRDLLEAAAGDVRAVRADHPVEVDVPLALAPVLADPWLLERALTSALHDAATGIAAGSAIRITASQVDEATCVVIATTSDAAALAGRRASLHRYLAERAIDLLGGELTVARDPGHNVMTIALPPAGKSTQPTA